MIEIIVIVVGIIVVASFLTGILFKVLLGLLLLALICKFVKAL